MKTTPDATPSRDDETTRSSADPEEALNRDEEEEVFGGDVAAVAAAAESSAMVESDKAIPLQAEEADVGDVNPQEASTPETEVDPSMVDFRVTVHDDTQPTNNGYAEDNSKNSNDGANGAFHSTTLAQGAGHLSATNSNPEPSQRMAVSRKRRRKYRHSRSAAVRNESTRTRRGLSLPRNQYECVLCRRAIRKEEDNNDNNSFATDQLHVNNHPSNDPIEGQHLHDMEVYGDTSLGMKLSVVRGKVIVQTLNALADGRASPAQLTGKVQRGDVLLAINGVSLVSLPIDQLMQGLGPLSTPHPVTGEFERNLRLRFAAAEGLTILQQHEKVNHVGGDTNGSPIDPASDVFSLFPMVDQLSGTPLFDDEPLMLPTLKKQRDRIPLRDNATEQANALSVIDRSSTEATIATPKKLLPLIETISRQLADYRTQDRDTFCSEFFEWNADAPKLLRESKPEEPTEVFTVVHDESDSEDESTPEKTKTVTERLALGRRARRGARALSYSAEQIDRGDDVRSFRSWNTTLSLYSRASTRRRYVLDPDSALPVHFDTVQEEEEEDGDSTGKASGTSDDEEPMDSDELLLRLAAHDDIWRKQVVEFLEKTIHDPSENEHKDASSLAKEEVVNGDTPGIDDVLSRELGNFLFGENMTKVLAKNKKPQALPPEEITAVLFDLTTKVSSTVPDEITAAGSYLSFRSRLVPFTGMKRPTPGSDAMLATRFLLDDALPVWLKSYRPLPWDQRRVLWPLDMQTSTAESSMAASVMSDDLTLDSMSTSQYSPRQHKQKNLREQIEDQELNIESRAETCFLATFYFTQKLLPELLHKQAKAKDALDGCLFEDLTSFVERYGSYLKMHTCLAYAAVVRADTVISRLLEVAKHDPRHKQAMKQLSKAHSLTFYEPTMLSAILQKLHELKNGSIQAERQLALIDLCVSAFPDVRPWQVRKACIDGKNSLQELQPLYYTYLSLLLHPTDGHDNARNDGVLVKEWCELSTTSMEDGTLDGDKRTNFMYVASRNSSDHLAYQRDLVFLAKLAMKIDEENLVFDLATEILDDHKLSRDQTTLRLVLSFLRTIGFKALEAESSEFRIATHPLRRILRLFRKAANKSSLIIRQCFHVPTELQRLLEYRVQQSRQVDFGTVLPLIDFLASEAVPTDVLEALVTTTSPIDFGEQLYSTLQTCLRRAAQGSLSSELSGSLLRLRKARQFVNVERQSDEGGFALMGQSVWKNMSKGLLTVNK